MEIIHDQTSDTGLAAAQKILEYAADRMTITVIVLDVRKFDSTTGLAEAVR